MTHEKAIEFLRKNAYADAADALERAINPEYALSPISIDWSTTPPTARDKRRENPESGEGET